MNHSAQSALPGATAAPIDGESPRVVAPGIATPLRYISAERAKPYLEATRGHRKDALILYRWNVAISARLYEALSFFEVPLRNAMDEQLRDWNATQRSHLGSRLSGEWCREPAPLLDAIARKDIDSAYERAVKELDIKHGEGKRSPSHDDVIAQTSLGMWRYLLPSNSTPSKQKLWRDALHNAFPALTRPAPQLVAAVDAVYRLRNRVAHLEPLIGINIEAAYKNMQTVVGDIDPDLRSWFASVTTGVKLVLDARPGARKA